VRYLVALADRLVGVPAEYRAAPASWRTKMIAAAFTVVVAAGLVCLICAAVNKIVRLT
jgi:hypothetical protein